MVKESAVHDTTVVRDLLAQVRPGVTSPHTTEKAVAVVGAEHRSAPSACLL